MSDLVDALREATDFHEKCECPSCREIREAISELSRLTAENERMKAKIAQLQAQPTRTETDSYRAARTMTETRTVTTDQLDTLKQQIEVGLRALADVSSELYRVSAENKRLREALRWFVEHERSIRADVSSAHAHRGDGASQWMREDDQEFRADLRRAFENAHAALSENETRALKDGE